MSLWWVSVADASGYRFGMLVDSGEGTECVALEIPVSEEERARLAPWTGRPLTADEAREIDTAMGGDGEIVHPPGSPREGEVIPRPH